MGWVPRLGWLCAAARMESAGTLLSRRVGTCLVPFCKIRNCERRRKVERIEYMYVECMWPLFKLQKAFAA